MLVYTLRKNAKRVLKDSTQIYNIGNLLFILGIIEKNHKHE